MITVTLIDYQSDAGFTKDTPYLALTGELWDVFYEYVWENWPRYNGTALYMHQLIHCGLVTPYGDWVNIGSGNRLMPGGTKPLLEPMLTYH